MIHNSYITAHVYIAYNIYVTHNLNKARVISRKDIARAFFTYSYYFVNACNVIINRNITICGV